MKTTMFRTGPVTGAIVLLLLFAGTRGVAAGQTDLQLQSMPPMMDMIAHFCRSTGLYAFLFPADGGWTEGLGRLIMLLLPMGFGAILTNIPLAGMNDPGGMLQHIYLVGIKTGAFPLIIFMGVGAMTDFGPMLANPRTALLGAAAQFGIFSTLIGALLLSRYVPGIDFDLLDAASIGIIGGADGPTAIFLASQLSPHLLGSIAVAAYSYMALVPIIQPPIMRALTSPADRRIRMEQMRHVGKVEKIVFPLIVLGLSVVLLPSAADKFLTPATLGILLLGAIAFSIGTASGVLMARIMNLFPGARVNPLIGSAGVSAVPMAARVSHRLGMEADPENMLLMHAMGPNVAGVIGSAVAAGVLLTLKDFAG
jgi:oxaloacetate decarboxylase beta subunit